MKHSYKKSSRFIVIAGILSGLLLSSLLYSLFIRQFFYTPANAANSLEAYCQNGIYNLPGNISCGRAPDCGGKTYADVEKIDWNNQNTSSCWLVTSDRCAKTCKGKVPLCCYEIERTGDPLKCAWPERGYCHPKQCQNLTHNNCGGGDCHCGGPIVTWCKDVDHCITSADQIPYLSLSERLGGAAAPTTGSNPTPTTSSGTATSISNSKLSVFILDQMTSGAQAILDAGPRIVKVITYDPKNSTEQANHTAKMEAIKKYKQKFPNGIAIIRFYPQNPISFKVTDDPVQAAQSYFDQLDGRKLDDLGSYKQYFDYNTGPNEFEFNTGVGGSARFPLPWQLSGETDSTAAVAREKWQAKFWKKFTELDNSKGIKTCIFSSPPDKLGNGELKNMLPELDDMRKMGAAICYHQYRGDTQGYYSKFYDQFNQVSGQYPSLKDMKIIIGEGGEHGWQNNTDSFKSYLTGLDNTLKNDGRVLGMTLFQIGSTNSVWNDINLEPLSTWLADYIRGGSNQPTSGPTSAQPTSSAPANCPTTSSEKYQGEVIANLGDNRPAESHPDKNIQMRGYELTSAEKKLVHYDAGNSEDTKAPQLSTLLDTTTPPITNLYKVYDWNWGQNGALGSKGGLLNIYPATLMGLGANPGAAVRVPDSQYNVGGGHDAYVLFASETTITLGYIAEDRIIGAGGNGYGIHIEGICVDPNLLNLYKDLNTKGRGSLPILNGKQKIGTAKTSEVKVAVRDSGQFMDPRSDDWWLGISSLPTGTAPTSLPPGPTSTNPTPTTPNNPKPTNHQQQPAPTKPPKACAPPLPKFKIDYIEGNGSTTALTLPEFPPEGPFTRKWQYGWLPAGKYHISWTESARAKRYALRIDHNGRMNTITDPWIPTEGGSAGCVIDPAKYPGGVTTDFCNNHMTTAGIDYTFEAGHEYNIWVHSLNDCGGWEQNAPLNIEIPEYKDNPTATCENYCPADFTRFCTYNDYPNFKTCFQSKYASSLDSQSTIYSCSTCVPAGSTPTPVVTVKTSPSPTVVPPTPTPTACPALPVIAWRDGEKYTRSVIAYDGTDVIENISLHLKRIIEEDAAVEISTDNGATWTLAEKPSADDFIITVVNKHTESFRVQIRATNACGKKGEALTVDVGTVPLPTLSITVTPSVSLPPRNPLSPVVIVGGAVLLVLVAAAAILGL